MEDNNTVTKIGDGRLRLIRDFNLAGREGAHNWSRLVNLAQQAGFSEIDFQRGLGAPMRMVEQWKNRAGFPPEAQREIFRKRIHDTLEKRTERPQVRP